MTTPERISVVIPVLNEQAGIGSAIEATRLAGVERILVDGGSRDGTVETVRKHGVEQLIESAPGRGLQMDAGWRAATGTAVVFLHADTRLEPGWPAAVRRALADASVAGGAFRLCFEAPGVAFRIIELGARLRARVARLPYGDQALFVRRAVLEAAGGVPHVPIFEDLDLVRTIRRAGVLALLPERSWTSARRYRDQGVMRTVVRNPRALVAYGLGLERDRVARWYRGGRSG